MNGILSPSLSLQADETVMSWVCRLAKFHTGGSVPLFLNDLGIPILRLIVGDVDALGALAKTTGETLQVLHDHQPTQTERRRFSFRGNQFSSEFMLQNKTAYCPQCLLEDEASYDKGRVGRWMWLFEPVRVCERHNIVLEVHFKSKWSDLLRNLGEIAPEVSGLEQLVDTAQRKSPSPLQDYVINRLRGMDGPEWLDIQTIEQASRAATMLGVLQRWGASVKADDNA
jgi:hypothetical protein